jgi:hypothetical protein
MDRNVTLWTPALDAAAPARVWQTRFLSGAVADIYGAGAALRPQHGFAGSTTADAADKRMVGAERSPMTAGSIPGVPPRGRPV